MNSPTLAGTLPRLLCLPAFLLVLTSSDGLNPKSERAQRLKDEMVANVDATLQNPSVAHASELSGPPLQLRPYVRSAPVDHTGRKIGHAKGC